MKKVKTFISEENFRNYAKEQGWFETALYANVVFLIKKDKTPSNMLTVARKVFKSNYVGKDSYKDSWKYTIYCGDKETMKFWDTPIRGIMTESKAKRDMRKWLKESIEDLKETYGVE